MEAFQRRLLLWDGIDGCLERRSQRTGKRLRLVHPDRVTGVLDRVEPRVRHGCDHSRPEGRTQIDIVVRADDHPDGSLERLESRPVRVDLRKIIGIFKKIFDVTEWPTRFR